MKSVGGATSLAASRYRTGHHSLQIVCIAIWRYKKWTKILYACFCKGISDFLRVRVRLLLWVHIDTSNVTRLKCNWDTSIHQNGMRPAISERALVLTSKA